MNISFLKKSGLTIVSATILLAVVALSPNTGAKPSNSQSPANAPSYASLLSFSNTDQDQPDQLPLSVDLPHKNLCQTNSFWCRHCVVNTPAVCWICPTNPQMMIACRLENPDEQVVAPPSATQGISNSSDGDTGTVNSPVSRVATNPTPPVAEPPIGGSSGENPPGDQLQTNDPLPGTNCQGGINPKFRLMCPLQDNPQPN